MKLKKHSKTFILGLLIGAIFTSMFTPVIADTISKTIEVLINDVNVKIGNTTLAKQNENYTLSNGQQVPYSILYKGTTYLPLRKVAEAVGKEVGWDQNTKTASINDKEIVSTHDDKLKFEEVSIIKINDKYYDFGGIYYWINNSNTKFYIETDINNYALQRYVHLLLGTYKIEEGHENPNLNGTIIFNSYEWDRIVEENKYDGAEKIVILTATLKIDENKSIVIKRESNSNERKITAVNPSNLLVDHAGYYVKHVDLSVLYNFLGVKAPKIYYDESMKCYIIELVK